MAEMLIVAQHAKSSPASGERITRRELRKEEN
jgi:hypothetical protein